MNKEIFKTFLESDDWNHNKTLDLFEKVNQENEEKILELEKDVSYYKEKNEKLKKVLDETLEQYDKCLQLCNDMNEKLKYNQKKINEICQEISKIKKKDISIKEKNKKLVCLFCDYKKDFCDIMGLYWYKNCITLVEKFNDMEENTFHKNILDKFFEIVKNNFL